MSTVHENTKSGFQAGLITYKGVWMVVCNIVFFIPIHRTAISALYVVSMKLLTVIDYALTILS